MISDVFERIADLESRLEIIRAERDAALAQVSELERYRRSVLDLPTPDPVPHDA